MHTAWLASFFVLHFVARQLRKGRGAGGGQAATQPLHTEESATLHREGRPSFRQGRLSI